MRYQYKDPYTGEEEEILIENTETRDQPKNRENAMRQMKGDVAELAMKAAAKVIGKNSGADQDLSLYDQFIEEAGDPDDSDRR